MADLDTNRNEYHPVEVQEETVQEEVVPDDPLSPKFMIDQESGEILLLDSVDCTGMDTNSLSFIISKKKPEDTDHLEGVQQQVEEPLEDNTIDVREINPSEANSSDEGEEEEIGPLSGQLVVIETCIEPASPSNDLEIEINRGNNVSVINNVQHDLGDLTDGEDQASKDTIRVNSNEVIHSEVNSSEIIDSEVSQHDESDGDEDNESLDEEEIVQQTIYLDDTSDNPVEEPILNEPSKEQVPFEGDKKSSEQPLESRKDTGLFQTDKSLQSIILSNVDGVQQIAIVRKKGYQSHKFDQKKLLEHLTSVLTGDYQINQGGPLKILEIEVDAAEGEHVSAKAQKLALTYAKKEISNPCLEVSGNISVGTQASKWTKMAEERVKVARRKILKAKPSVELGGRLNQEDEAPLPPGIISRPQQFTSLFGTSRTSVSTQVNYEPSRGLVDEEEMELMKEKIIKYIEAGNTLSRTCPGCGKELSKAKNLVVHLETRHCVRLEGRLGEALRLRQKAENTAIQCPRCSLSLSKKSLRRHLRIVHGEQ